MGRKNTRGKRCGTYSSSPGLQSIFIEAGKLESTLLTKTCSIKNTLKAHSHNITVNKYQNISNEHPYVPKHLLTSRWHLFFLLKISFKKKKGMAPDLVRIIKTNVTRAGGNCKRSPVWHQYFINEVRPEVTLL